MADNTGYPVNASTINLGTDERQVLINLHSTKGPEDFEGMLNLGEIGVSHPNTGDDTEKKKNTKLVTPNPVGNIVAFPSEQAVSGLVSDVKDELESEILAATVHSSDSSVTIITSTTGTDLSVNIDGTTIVKDGSTGKLSVASDALTQYKGENAITISEVDTNNTKTVSLLINSANKVLSQKTDGLDTTLNLKYNKRTESSKATIQLVGIGDAVISEFDATDLVMDGVLDKVELNDGVLTFTWNTDADKTATSINLGDYIKPYSAGDGLNLTGETFSVKIKGGEKYLKVSEDGLESQGIETLVSTEIGKLNANVTSTGGSKVTVKVVEEDGKVKTVTVTETDIASETALNAEIKARKDVDGQAGQTYTANSNTTYISAATSLNNADVILDTAIKNVSDTIDNLNVTAIGGQGKVITTVSQTKGKISAESIDLTATNVAATAVSEGGATNVQGILGELSEAIKDVSDAAISVTAGNGIDITTVGTVNTIAAKVKSGDTYIEVTSDGIASKGIDAAITSAITALDSTKGEATVADGKHVAVQVVEVDGVITEVNVSENDIASAKALTEEIAARKAVDGQNGQTYAANTGTNYISSATSLNDADKKLDEAIKGLSDKSITGVTMNGAAKTVTNNVVGLGNVVTGVQDLNNTDFRKNANVKLVLGTDGTYVLDFSKMIIDCGTF